MTTSGDTEVMNQSPAGGGSATRFRPPGNTGARNSTGELQHLSFSTQEMGGSAS